MKKLVVVLFVLCSMLFLANPILKSAFAENDSKPNNKVVSTNKDTLNEVKQDKTSETNNEALTVPTTEKDDVKDITIKEDSSSNKINSNDKSNNDLEVKTEAKKDIENDSVNKDIEDTKPVETTPNDQTTKPAESEEVSSTDQTNVSKALTMEDALKLLKNMNPNLVYEYQGDENTFPVLKDKGLSGYVFLPNVDTDLGYFVDKNTSSIYYFHPSGYLEKIK
jgi:hypothetical protein